MTDDIAAMTLELAQDPGSLVFLRLADALRRKGQLDAALTVASRGAARYRQSAEAHDLVARIQSDLGNGDAAFDAWTAVLRVAPDHIGAHKGLAFLAYRSGDLARSVRHLGRALELAPGDTTLSAAIERLRTLMLTGSAAASAPAPADPPADGPTGTSVLQSTPTLLCDQQGRVLRGRLDRVDGADASDAVAASLAGLSREAERAASLLGLGAWRAIAVESGAFNYELRTPTEETLLVVMRGREVPAGRLARIADKAVEDARQWIENLG